MSSDDQQFEVFEQVQGCIPTQVGSIKKGGFCMLKGFPCKVTEYSTAKPGKHGAAKATIVGNDIFTGKKYEDGGPTSSNIMVPSVTKQQYPLAYIANDGYASLLRTDGSLKEDIRVDDLQIFTSMKRASDKCLEGIVYVISAIGKQKIVEFRLK